MNKSTIGIALSIFLCSPAILAAGSPHHEGHSEGTGVVVSQGGSASQGQSSININGGLLGNAPNQAPVYGDETAIVYPNSFGGSSIIFKSKPPHIDPRIDLPAGAVPPPAGVIEYHGDLPQNFKGKIIGGE